MRCQGGGTGVVAQCLAMSRKVQFAPGAVELLPTGMPSGKVPQGKPEVRPARFANAASLASLARSP